MTCAEAEELIEPVASGDVPPPAAFTAHLADCRACAAALAAAVGIERALAAQEAPAAPPRFTQAVVAAIRRGSWQDEERIDRVFNITIGLAVLAVAVGILGLLNASGLAQMWLVAVDALSEIPNQSPPWSGSYSTPVASITAAFVITAVVIWWWAERRPDYGEP